MKLYGFGAGMGVLDPSPYVLKVMAYLNISGQAFDYIGDAGNLQKAPRGKLPFMEDSGEVITDSFNIICHIDKQLDKTVDDHLTAEQRSLAYLLGRSLDEDYYWFLVYSRWVESDGWALMKQNIADGMPFPLSKIIPLVARPSVVKKAKLQGVAKRDTDEIYQLVDETLLAFNTLLGEKTFLLSDQVSSLDAVAYSYFAQQVYGSQTLRFNQLIEKYPKLVAYVKRFHEQYMVN